MSANISPDLTYHGPGGTLTYDATSSYYIQRDPFIDKVSPYKSLPFPDSEFIILSARQVSFTPNTLGTTTHIYTSPKYEDIIALADYFADWGCSYTVQEGPNLSINVQAPWDTVSSQDWNISLFASEQWEIIPQQGSKSILQAGQLADPFTPPNVSSSNYIVLPDVLKIAVKYAKDNNTAINLSGSRMSSASLATMSQYMPYAQSTLDYLRMGVESIPSYTQILKRTATIDKNNINRAFQKEIDEARNSINAQGTINYILSTQDLIQKFSIPADTVGAFLLPSYSKRLSVTNVDTSEVYVSAGWLVKPPTLTFIGRNKLQLTQELVWDEWLDYLYYNASDASHFPEVQSAATTPDARA